MKPSSKIPASAAILVGGKSTRFGSDKAFLQLDIQPVSIQLHNLFYPIFNDVFFVSNEKKRILDNQKLVVDIFPNKGPLGGIFTALKNSGEEYCFVTACDTPFINNHLIDFIWNNNNGEDIIIPVWKNGVEPLVAFYHKRCLSRIEQLIEVDKLSVMHLLEQLNIRKVHVTQKFSDEELERIFININSPANFEKALKIMDK